jgi:hypothetical protein
MSYNELLNEVKNLILPTIIDRVNPEDVIATGLSKVDIANIIYSQIMSLGYNDGDINASINDLMPTRNPIIYNKSEIQDAMDMALHLNFILEDYKFQYWAFKSFHENTQAGMNDKNVLIEVEKFLLYC